MGEKWINWIMNEHHVEIKCKERRETKVAGRERIAKIL